VRRAALLIGLGGAVVALALTASPPKQAQPPAKVTHDELPVFVHTGNTLEVIWSQFSAEKRPERLADTLAVFAKPRALEDVLPPILQQLTRLMSQPGFELDRPLARLLVASGTHRVYGVPMKNGSVCIFREPFGSNCVPALLHGAYPQVDAGWRSRRGQVWGLADNGAVSVRVRLTSRWLAAKLGRNGFYLELPPRIVAPRQIVIRERSGIRHVYDIKRCRVDDIALPLLAGPVAPPLC
jgi:hypothetical protein